MILALPELAAELRRLGLTVQERAPLSRFTRFGIGGPADILADAPDEEALAGALALGPALVLGEGTNVICSDAGYRGVIVRYRGERIWIEGGLLHCQTGASLQALVDFSIAHSLAGLHTMTRIPGWVGAALYGNAGAYGNSIGPYVESVRFLDGGRVREFANAECGFAYRESVFKKHKEWVLLSAALRLPEGERRELEARAAEIQKIRDVKYPPAMRCAGSVFKNLILAELPEEAAAAVPAKVVIEGKVPSAWFLEQVGAKGMRRGDIQIAAYHANLIYNDGAGTAADLVALIAELKERVRERFGLELEEEVQYVGF
jgi:UDP-N-acetylmuramate dehydrogenase